MILKQINEKQHRFILIGLKSSCIHINQRTATAMLKEIDLVLLPNVNQFTLLNTIFKIDNKLEDQEVVFNFSEKINMN